MSPRPHPAPARWDARRWALVAALIFVLEVSLVHVLSWRPEATLPPFHRETTLRFASDPALASRLRDLVWLPDAAQLATVNPHGFTAPLWRDTPPPALPAGDLGASPRWQEIPLASAGSVAEFALRAPLPRLVVATPLRPARRGVRVEGAVLAPKSLLDVRGDLAGRRVVHVPDLPVWPLDDILRPSEVQVLVNAEGDVLSALLQPPGSGLAEADAKAVELAQQVLFAPLNDDPGRLTWGRLRFRWASAPPPAATNQTATATNTPAAAQPAAP